MAVKTYRKTALVTAEQFLPAIGQIPKGVYSDGHGDPRKRPDCKWVLDTKEGRHDVRGDDYICTGPAGEQWNVAKDIFEATYEEVSALTAAFAAMPGPEVKVRELEWRKLYDESKMWPMSWHGRSRMGNVYAIEQYHKVGQFYTVGNGCDTLEAAKDAAQADYEARILSALTPAPDLASENERLRKMLAGCDWYWPEDDTSSEACADGPWQIVENCDVKPGEVFGYSRGGVVETRYYGFLEAAADSGSDDQFEADEPTREAAEAKISAELTRRAALERT